MFARAITLLAIIAIAVVTAMTAAHAARMNLVPDQAVHMAAMMQAGMPVHQALEILRGWPFPLVAQLRDSQAYVVLTGLGKSLFDYHSAQVREHQADWEPLLRWLKKD